MSTMKQQRHPVVVSAGCGCRGSRIFSSSSGNKEPSTSLRYHLSLSSSSLGNHSDEFGPSASSSDNFAEGNTSSCQSSLSGPDDDAASLSHLLRQLSDLEHSLLPSTPHKKSTAPPPTPPPPPSAVCGGGSRRRRRKLGESVAVEKSSADPLADFRWSMLQMIVEKQIVTVDELQDLLHCFLSLNSPHHHQIILQAFFDVCNYAFAPS